MMTRSFSEHYAIVFAKFCDMQKDKVNQPSRMSFARFLGISQGKAQAWERGQWPSAADCTMIERKLGLSLRWLVTGEGDPEGKDENTPLMYTFSNHVPLPLYGLASCGVDGYEQVMPFATAVSPIVLSPNSVAILASGESMVPAGIASGQICYCDPDQTAMPGEAVFLRRMDGLGSIKVYLGPSERDGFMAFKGWLPANEAGERREFKLEISNDQISCIAPVIFIRRRL